MSSGRATSREFVPQVGDLIFQLGNGPIVVQHVISGGQPGLAAGLGSDPGTGLIGGESIAIKQPPDLDFLINIDHHDDVESVLLTGFH